MTFTDNNSITLRNGTEVYDTITKTWTHIRGHRFFELRGKHSHWYLIDNPAATETSDLWRARSELHTRAQRNLIDSL